MIAAKFFFRLFSCCACYRGYLLQRRTVCFGTGHCDDAVRSVDVAVRFAGYRLFPLTGTVGQSDLLETSVDHSLILILKSGCMSSNNQCRKESRNEEEEEIEETVNLMVHQHLDDDAIISSLRPLLYIVLYISTESYTLSFGSFFYISKINNNRVSL